MIFSGIEGEHWNVVDGEAVWTDEVLAANNAGGDVWRKTGITFGALTQFAGLGDNEIYEKDNSPLWLRKGDDYMTRSMQPVDTAYCKKYNISYPMEIFLNMKKEGKAATHDTLDLRIVSGMGSAPDDIALHESSILKTAAEAIPGLVTAKTDAEFSAQKDALMSTLESSGLQKVIDWYQMRHQEVLKSFGK